MNDEKLALSVSLNVNNRAQMLALANFAASLAEGEVRLEQAPATRPKAPTPTEDKVAEAVAASEAAQDPPTPTEEKPKRKRRTAAEIEADQPKDRKPAPRSADAEEAEEVESEAAEEEQEDGADAVEDHKAEEAASASRTPSKITLDDVRRAVAEKKDRHLQIMKFKLKQDFGVTKTPDLQESQYEAFYNFLQTLD